MHLVTLKDWTPAQILEVVNTSSALRQNPGRDAQSLAGRTLALLFQKTSTRTRCAGEIGIAQLGGRALYLDWRSTNFGLADLGDEIRVLSEYVDFITVRFLRHADVRRAAETARVPVMNGCCDRYHPLQILADLQTIQETLGRLEGVRLTYVGAHNNVCNSLIAAGLKVGMKITVATPEPEPAAADAELCEAGRRAGLYSATTDLRAALAQCDVVYTDTWIDMEYFLDPVFAAEKERRLQLYMPYQLNRALLTGLDLRIMHCLPAHRGYEIEGELLDDPRSIVMAQAQNRLHSQKAVLLKLAGTHS
ncbi:MAG: ornithine carbamoyltransferase [Candidatus Latescibacteria bacterium]|nr:ornithine carbamoyltransferase [Candidatus Latescibacterota bacterium]